MEIGIFAKTFVRPKLEEVLDAVLVHGLRCVQFNLVCAGLATLPEEIEPSVMESVREGLNNRKIKVAAISGTFNMIHPDMTERRAGLRRLGVVGEASRQLGCGIVTLCTGSRDARNMWRRHPENDSQEAWKDLLCSLEEALKIAEMHQLILGIEPELANVVSSPKKARRLLEEMRSPRLKVVLDAANLLTLDDLPRQEEILAAAFDSLGGDIVLAHAKDFPHGSGTGSFAAGKGDLDFEFYLRLLHSSGFDGSVILHGLLESEVPGAVAFLEAKLDALSARPNLVGKGGLP